jgi:hypothetical protein
MMVVAFSAVLGRSSHGEEVRASAADIALPVWVAAESHATFASQDYDKPVLLSALLTMYRGDPTLSAADAVQKLSAIKYNLDGGLGIRVPQNAIGFAVQATSFERLVKLGFEIMGETTLPGELQVAGQTIPAGTRLKIPAAIGAALFDISLATYQAYQRGVDALNNYEAELYGQVRLGGQLSHAPTAAFMQKLLKDAYALRNNPEAVNALIALGFQDPNTPTGELLAQNSDWADSETLILLRDLLSGLSTDVQSIAAVEAQVNERLLILNTQVRAGLTATANLQRSFSNYLQTEEKRRERIEQAQIETRLAALQTEATRSSIYILSTLIGFSNPKVGRELAGAGNALLQATEALNKYRVAIEEIDRSLPGAENAENRMIGASLGGIVLAGDMLSVGLQLYSLFDGGGSSELAQFQQISRQLRQLSEQIATFRTEMHKRFDQIDYRFDRLDSRLNAIYDALVAQLGYIDWTLGRVSGDVTGIRMTLTDLQADVRTLEQRLGDMMSSGFRRDLQDTMSLALGYRQHFNALMPRDKFNEHANYFKQWAVVHAGDPLELAPATRYDDPSISDQLSSYSLSSNIAYLSAYPTAKFGLPPLFSAPSLIVNPNDWVVASLAFVRLLQEWPDHARAANFDSDIAAIQARGQALRNAIAGIQSNAQLFERLIGRGSSIHPSSFRGTVSRLGSAVAARRAAYPVRLGNTLTDLNAWGGVSQSSTYVVSRLRDPSYKIPPYHYDFIPGGCPRCDKQAIPITPPEGLNGLLGNTIRNLEQLGAIGPYGLEFIVRPGYKAMRTVGSEKFLDTTYTVAAYVRNPDFDSERGGIPYFVLFSRVLDGPSVKTTEAGADIFDLVWEKMVAAWESNYRNRFASQSVPGGSGPNYYQVVEQNFFDPTVSRYVPYANRVLGDAQRDFYRSILPEFTNGGAIHDLSLGIMGATRALVSFVQLGFPESVSSNEYLRSLLSGPPPLSDPLTIQAWVSGFATWGADDPLRYSSVPDLDFVVVGEVWLQQIEPVLLRLIGSAGDGKIERAAIIENTLSRLASLRQIRTLRLADDVTARIAVSLVSDTVNMNTGRRQHVVQITNKSGSAIAGPISFVLDGLSETVTMVNGDGLTEFTQPTGSPKKTVLLETATLEQNATVSITLEFAAASAALSYQPRLLAGIGLDGSIPEAFAATFTAPASGSVLPGATAMFQWTSGQMVGDYWLYLGSAPGNNDYFSEFEGSNLSSTVHNVPTDGRTIYARLWSWSFARRLWHFSDAVFTAARPLSLPAEMTSPTVGSTLTTTVLSLAWSAGANVSQYWLSVGTAAGGIDLFNQATGQNMSATIDGLPANGGAIYVRLWSLIDGAWRYNDYSYTAMSLPAVPRLMTAGAEMTTPAPASTLTASAVEFHWTGGKGVAEYWLDAATTPDGQDLWSQSAGTSLSATLTGLPTYGETIYLRLRSRINGSWQSKTYTYQTATTQVTPAELTMPAPGSTLLASTVQFQWAGGTGVTGYRLELGTIRGGVDLWNEDTGANLSTTVSGLPTDGSTVYVTLWSLVDGTWQSKNYTYEALTVAPVRAEIITPAPGSTLTASTVLFQWTGGAGTTQYRLDAGTTPGGLDLWNDSAGARLSATLTGLPTDGSQVYVRLWSLSGSTWQYNSYSYETRINLLAPAEMSKPAPHSTLTSSTVLFNWTGGTGATHYWLNGGTTPGATDLWNRDVSTGLSATIAGLPTDGSTFYVTLWSLIAGAWQYNSYTYTAATMTPTPAELASPSPGSTLNASTVQFRWTGGSEVSQYLLTVGTQPGGVNLWNKEAGTSLSATVSGLPTDGTVFYVTLWSLIEGNWQSKNYTYSTTPGGPVRAEMIAPAPGSTLRASTVQFQWRPGANATRYWLMVGTTEGGVDLWNGDAGTNLSAVVTRLPTDGTSVYVRLWSWIGTRWELNSYAFTAVASR